MQSSQPAGQLVSHLFALLDGLIGVEDEMDHAVLENELRIDVVALRLARVVVEANVIHEAA